MRHIFYIFLYLNIYTAFFQYVYSQEFTLIVKAEKPVSESLLDSLNVQSVFKDYLTLKKEADTLVFKLQSIGYLESELRSLEKTTDSSFTARYFFGRKSSHIKVYYKEEEFSKKELARISNEVGAEYFLLDFQTFEQSLQKLNAIKTENGDAFARLGLSNILKNADGSISVELSLERGSSRTIDSLIVKGYEKFPRSFLRYYAGVKTGKKFNRPKLIAQNDALNSLGFVNSLKAPEVLFRDNETVVYFYLEKRNNNLFDGILGFATDEETNRLEFNGYLNLELNNNLNFGEQLLINYKADGNEQQNFRVRTTMPYLFRTPFGVSLELKIFKRDSSFVTTEQMARLTYQINPSSSVYSGYKGYESSNLLDDQVAGIPIEDYTSNFLIGGISFQKPQRSTLFPIKTLVLLDSEIGTRDQKGVQEDQLRLSVVASTIFNLNFRNSIFLQNSSSLLISDTYLTNELFRFGGITSIRGFDENSIDATAFAVLNTEYRYQFNEGIYLHSIIDLAYFENQLFAMKEKLYSFGIGLGMQTKAGVFKFNIANGNSDNQNFNFSNTKIHLSLTSRF
ncbi:BamA/TamA family outer membrane protein [Constantimarinum furrinae]|uniref:Bacterial surface antigen (D15) domain-containing protein n=1 Tax=Constantimarinum furrinae TaxID=2562285 RepID=A0A7G8PUL5_9FLAO|nr:BamA/TamA family outer membrane protein [Constantimarinum furrinae]QNJ98031.1 hypothetical protein ALE3EI_1471 [Constantimarinum furrinae]